MSTADPIGFYEVEHTVPYAAGHAPGLRLLIVHQTHTNGDTTQYYRVEQTGKLSVPCSDLQEVVGLYNTVVESQ